MKNILSIILAAVLGGSMFTACRKADPVIRSEKKELADIYATMEGDGGSRLFEPRYSINKDTLYFDVPYFYPVNSDKEVDLKKLILRATIPSDSKMVPALGTVMDLSKPFSIEISSGSGDKKSYVIVAKKVGDVSLTSAKIQLTSGGNTQDIEGVIQGTDVLFYVLPGTDITAAKLSYVINKHSSGSLALGASINLTQNVPFTVKGIDNTTKVYTLKAVEPVKLAYGFGINRKLWSKNASELSFTANMETGLAVSGDYLVLVRRTSPSKYSVYNRYTGAFVQDMAYPFGATLSFQMAEDTSGRLLAASWAPKNSKFILYKYNDPFDTNPVKLVDWTNNNPTGITGDGGVGRRVNLYGDLNGNAVIMATAGQSSVIYKWRIQNGQVVSNTPEVITYKSVTGGSSTFMGYYAEAQPISADANTDYYLNYQFEVALVNGTTHERTGAFSAEPEVTGIFHMPTAYTRFNNANYLAIVKYVTTYDLNRVHMSLFDITNSSKIGTTFTSPDYARFNPFVSEQLAGTTNGNGTADICIAYSPDKERMQVYMMLTNGGILAQEFTKYAP